MQPDQVSHFKILDSLGSGAMGVVYRARDTQLGRDVALKLIRPERAADPHLRSRFVGESRAAAAINHPGIATVYEAGETDDGQLFFASEFVDGETLQERLHRGPLSHAAVIYLGLQLAEALAASHSAGIVHRDIKPSNLMITAGDHLKILDFGLARLVAVDDAATIDAGEVDPVTRTKAGVIVGTPAYMSPEQASGMAVSARCDVFAAGAVLYEMVCGQPAFLSDTPQNTLRRVFGEDASWPKDMTPSVPSELDTVIQTALAKDPAARYASGEELATALRALKPAILTTVVSPRRRRRRIAAVAVAGIVGLIAVLLIRSSIRPSFAFGTRDKLLIADVENRTGESVFDLALRTALENDLQNSPYASVFDKGQVRDVLRLMRRDPSSLVNEELGRDICRFARVRALLLPRILSAGDAYELQVILVDPVNGRHVDRIRVRAEGREAVLLDAVDEIAREVRTQLGESLMSIEEADYPIAEATTSSWEALHYLARGQALWAQARSEDAASLFELAVEKDSTFASARGSLGLVLIQFLDQGERGKKELQRALRDAEDLPKREYLMLKAVHRQFVEEDLEGALREYQLVSELHPDLYQPANNSGRIFWRLGRIEEAAAKFETAAELAPHSMIPLRNLWFLYINEGRNPTAAEHVARRGLILDPDSVVFQHALAWSLIARAKFPEALELLRKVLKVEPRHEYAFPNLAHVLFALGRPAEAIPLYREIVEQYRRGERRGSARHAYLDLAMALDSAGQTGEVKSALAGADAELQKMVDGGEAPVRELLLGAQIDAVGGRRDEAELRLNQALNSDVPIDDPVTLRELAELYALLGEKALALETLRHSLDAGLADPYFPLVMVAFHSIRDDPRFLELFGIDET